MIKNLKKLTALGLMVPAVMGTSFFINGIEAEAASVGTQLLQPESGWTRYDDSDSRLVYQGEWSHLSNQQASWPNSYNGTVSGNYETVGDQLLFQFSGTGVRILTNASSWNSGANVKIDGVDYGNYCCYNSSAIGSYLLFEKCGLSQGLHKVELTTINKSVVAPYATGSYCCPDAIDIYGGTIVTYNSQEPVNVKATGISLNKTTDKISVGQSDSLAATVTPANAANKNVTWTSSNSSVASVDNSGKVTGIKEGTAVITAKTTDGTNLSASCTVNVYNNLIEDANLRQAILTALNKPADYILTEADLNNLTWLDASNKNIKTLKGLEYCKNLDALKVEKNNISDLSPLANITKLHWLNAGYNNITDITSLKTMTGLDVIILPNNKISDLTPLKGNKNIKMLFVFSNNITDISALKDCTSLEQLSLAFNNVQDITAVEKMTNLKNLYLHFTNISDISVLANLTNLEQLNLGWNNITDVSALKNLTKLDTVWVNNNKIKDLTPVTNLNVPTLKAQDQTA